MHMKKFKRQIGLLKFFFILVGNVYRGLINVPCYFYCNTGSFGILQDQSENFFTKSKKYHFARNTSNPKNTCILRFNYM